MDNIYIDSGKNRVVVQKTLNLDSANNTVCMRSLVIVDIRGTSTKRDWLTDFVGTHASNNISYNTNGGNNNGTLEFLKGLANMEPLDILVMIFIRFTAQ